MTNQVEMMGDDRDLHHPEVTRHTIKFLRDGGNFDGIPCPYTKPELISEMMKVIGDVSQKRVLVLYTLEMALALKEAGCHYVTVATKASCRLTAHLASEMGCNYMLLPSSDGSERNAMTPDMKFHVVMGNPPYQNQNPNDPEGFQPKRHSLWIQFLEMSFSLAREDDGVICMVTPDSWMSPTNKGFKKFTQKQLVFADLDCSQHFDEGSSFSWWFAENKDLYKETVLKTGDGNKVSIDFRDLWYIPRNPDKTLSIHKKVMGGSREPLPFLMDTATCHTSHPHVVKEKSKKFCFPVFHTNAQTRHSNCKSKYFDDAKLMLTTSGYYVPRKDGGGVGISQIVMVILVKNDFEMDCYYSMLDSKLYEFIAETAKWSGFLHQKIIYALPKLEMKIWTDSEIYDYFELTEQERDYVESCSRKNS